MLFCFTLCTSHLCLLHCLFIALLTVHLYPTIVLVFCCIVSTALVIFSVCTVSTHLGLLFCTNSYYTITSVQFTDYTKDRHASLYPGIPVLNVATLPHDVFLRVEQWKNMCTSLLEV